MMRKYHKSKFAHVFVELQMLISHASQLRKKHNQEEHSVGQWNSFEHKLHIVFR